MGHRRALVEWKHPAHEKAQALRAITYLAEQLATRNVARLKWPEELHDRVDATWGHHIGATRMTRDPKRGVVDPNCRVHGMDNLHLAGASTFTTGGAANPTFTIVALALRLADHLAARV